jgi:hypothetical protein
MGTVFLGLDPTERAVAVKVLREGPADLSGRERFRRELAALERVRGDHLVEVLDGDVEAEPPWIVTRFVPGQRLDERVHDDGPLSEPALRRVADGLAEGLHHLHQAGVVHRDLSPGNVLLLDGEPQVIDLGLAQIADVTSHTRTSVLLGTAGYLAPEQVRGETCDERVDVHAWGAVVAFAGTGRPPYGTGRVDAVLYRVVHDEPDLDGLPWPLVDLVAAALDKDPDRRPTTAQLGRGIFRLPTLSDRPAPAVAPDVVALLGPQATEVLGSHVTQVLGSNVPEALGSHETRVLGEPTPQTARLSPPRTRVLAPLPVPDPAAGPAPGPPPGSPLVRAPAIAPPRRDDEVPGASAGVVPGAASDSGPASEPRRSRAQAWAFAVVGLLLVFAFARWVPWVTSAVALAGLLFALVAGRVRAAGLARREKLGPRGSDGWVALLKSPVHVVQALGDLLLVLPVGAGAGAGLAWLVSEGTPFGQAWLPEQDHVSDVRALAVASGLVVALAVGAALRPAQGARRLVRRVVTSPPGTTAGLLLAGMVVLAASVLAYVAGAAPVWAPWGGPVLP